MNPISQMLLLMGSGGPPAAPYGTWTVTASSLYAAYTGQDGARAPGLNDGLMGSSRSTMVGTDNGTGEWMKADFGLTEHVDTVTLGPATGIDGWDYTYLTGRALQYSTDGTSWTTERTLSFSTDEIQILTTSFDARYVRVYNSGADWNCLGEFHFELSPV